MMSFNKTVALKHATTTAYNGYNEKTITYSTAYIDVIAVETKAARVQEGQRLIDTDYIYYYYGNTNIPVPHDLIDDCEVSVVQSPIRPGSPYVIYVKKVSA